MPSYNAPVRDTRFVINELLDLSSYADLPGFEAVTPELVDTLVEEEQAPILLASLEEELAEQVARRAMEDRIEKRVTEKMDEKQEQYVQEIRAQVLKETAKEVETPHTKKKLAEAEAAAIVPAARPSRPSVRLTALVVPAKTKSTNA